MNVVFQNYMVIFMATFLLKRTTRYCSILGVNNLYAKLDDFLRFPWVFGVIKVLFLQPGEESKIPTPTLTPPPAVKRVLWLRQTLTKIYEKSSNFA